MSKAFKFAKHALKVLMFTTPVVITCLDTFGYIAMVEGVSMQPSLNPDDTQTNDFVYLNRWAIRNYEIEKGDIVVLTCPSNPQQKLIKRVVALEGDMVKNLSKRRWCTIPTGYCWVEGDHQGKSTDSNYFGPVSIGLILGKVSHVVWPPARWQKLEQTTFPEQHRRVFENARGISVSAEEMSSGPLS